ncbi:caspase-3 in complex with an inhibitory Darpin-3.4, partial [Choiromyces venosus 120613-1]
AIRWASSEQIIRTFIDCGARLDAMDYFGVTPLAAAAARGRQDVVELLLSRGAEVKMENMPKDMGGSTPLAIAVEMGNIHMAGILLANGRVDPNLSDNFLNTPLHKAVRRGNVGLVEMLVE